MTDNTQYKWRQRKKRNSLLTVWVAAVIVVAAAGTFAYEGLKESNPLNVAKKYVESTIGVDEYTIETGARSLNNDNQFVQEYTFTYTADGKEDSRKMNLVQKAEKKYGIFEQWGLEQQAAVNTMDIELIAPVDSQVLVDGVAPRDSEIKIDEELSPGAVCYDLTGVKEDAVLQVNGLPFDSYETTIPAGSAVIDVRDSLVIGDNAHTQMEETAKKMINELFTAVIQQQKADSLSSLFDQAANKANLFKAISNNLFDKDTLKVSSITFKDFKPEFGEVYYPGKEEKAFIGMEMKLSYTCEYETAVTEPETEAESEAEGTEETETETEKKASAPEKKSVSKEATFYFKYIDGECVVTTIEVPNVIA